MMTSPQRLACLLSVLAILLVTTCAFSPASVPASVIQQRQLCQTFLSPTCPHVLMTQLAAGATMDDMDDDSTTAPLEDIKKPPPPKRQPAPRKTSVIDADFVILLPVLALVLGGLGLFFFVGMAAKDAIVDVVNNSGGM